MYKRQIAKDGERNGPLSTTRSDDDDDVGVKVSPMLFAKVSISVSVILSVYSIGIVIGDTFCTYR